MSFNSGSSEWSPNRPTVKAMAPKAPMGDSATIISTIENTTLVSWSTRLDTMLARSPSTMSARPNSTATSMTCRMAPFAKASTMVLGMIFSRNDMTPWSLAAVT